jgi:maspardin
LKKIQVDEDASSDKFWSIYDNGPKSVSCPLICFPPVSGSAEVFFKQVMELPRRLNIRIIAVSYPTYWSYREFVLGFIRLLDHLRLDRVHIFGASVGGFLAQKVVESWSHCPRVASLILCNSFGDTAIFNQHDTSSLFWMMPGAVLKKMIMKNSILEDPYFSIDSTIKDSMVFVAESLNRMPQSDLASRLTLNCSKAYIEPHRVHTSGCSITVMDVFDRCALSQRVREDMYKMYPDAKRAHLKTGGNFPYLSRWQEVNMFIEIHLRQFRDTKYSPFESMNAVFENTKFHSSISSSSNTSPETRQSSSSHDHLQHHPNHSNSKETHNPVAEHADEVFEDLSVSGGKRPTDQAENISKELKGQPELATNS